MASLLGAGKRKWTSYNLKSRIVNDKKKINIKLKLEIQKINKDMVMLVG